MAALPSKMVGCSIPFLFGLQSSLSLSGRLTMVLIDVDGEILVGISCRTGMVRKLWLSMQQAPNFDAVNSGMVEKG